jgi:hypothetical protein
MPWGEACFGARFEFRLASDNVFYHNDTTTQLSRAEQEITAAAEPPIFLPIFSVPFVVILFFPLLLRVSAPRRFIPFLPFWLRPTGCGEFFQDSCCIRRRHVLHSADVVSMSSQGSVLTEDGNHGWQDVSGNAG